MDEYISKQKAKNLMGCCLASAKAEYKAAKDEFTKARSEDYISAIQAMIDVVGAVEVADVQPVKRGRWVIADDVEHFIAVCSECGRAEDSRDIKYMPYCHCGARMDLNSVTYDRCSNYMGCDGSCFIDDTPCDCGGNIEKCKGR